MAATRVYTRPATEAEARDLATRLRPAEIDELMAATGEDPLTVLVAAVRDSTESHAVYFNDELACIWGVMPCDAGQTGVRVGTAWLLTSDLVERYAKAFWRLCLGLVPPLLERWDVLFNFIDARHEKAVRWAKRLGFRVETPAPYGVAGMPFCGFVVAKEDLCALQQ